MSGRSAAATDPAQLFNEMSSTTSGSIMVPSPRYNARHRGVCVTVYLRMFETCLFNVDGTDVGVYMDTYSITFSSRTGAATLPMGRTSSRCTPTPEQVPPRWYPRFSDMRSGGFDCPIHKSSSSPLACSFTIAVPNPTSGGVTEINWTFTAKDPATFTLFFTNSTNAFDLKAIIGENLETDLGQIHTLLPTLPAVGGYALHAIRFENVAQESTFQKEWRPKIYLSESLFSHVKPKYEIDIGLGPVLVGISQTPWRQSAGLGNALAGGVGIENCN
ncbi:hypothetical protein B0H13DRAFT_1884594 [Mycena leptocephala]|nr:hypothetical protein B0H13DRAFT_1884594 [Mycena leptocephala]